MLADEFGTHNAKLGQIRKVGLQWTLAMLALACVDTVKQKAWQEAVVRAKMQTDFVGDVSLVSKLTPLLKAGEREDTKVK